MEAGWERRKDIFQLLFRKGLVTKKLLLLAVEFGRKVKKIFLLLPLQ